MGHSRPSYNDNACGRRQSGRTGRAGACRTRLYDGRVLLAALNELVVRQLRVLVTVHVPEDLVYALRGPGVRRSAHARGARGRGAHLLGRVLVRGGLDHLAVHLVY
jgi:hypothetical protein